MFNTLNVIYVLDSFGESEATENRTLADHVKIDKPLLTIETKRKKHI